MSPTYRNNYFDDSVAKAAFERYAMRLFNLDFGRWKKRGLWDSLYRPFSAFDGEECVASMCVYPSEITVNGEPRRGAQLLTVGTLPEYRRQGIQRRLWEDVQAWTKRESDFVFLFTDESAIEFYSALGLSRGNEFTDIVSIAPSQSMSKQQIRKLDFGHDADYEIVRRLSCDRTIVSNRLGFINPNLLLFMFLYLYSDLTYYLAEIDSIVVAQIKGDRLCIYDIVASRMPELPGLEPMINHFGKQELEFHFCTDRLGISELSHEPITDSLLFVSEGFDLPGRYQFPDSIRA